MKRYAEGRNQIGQTGIRKLNTRVYQDNDHFAVQLYATVVYDETRERLVLDNGGWVTPTTVSRINQAIDHRGFSDLGHVRIIRGQMYFQSITVSVPFVGGKFVLDLKAVQQSRETGDLMRANARLAQGA